MTISFFTLASRNYLSYAATLMQSLRAAYPEARRVIGLVDAPDLQAAAGLDLAAEVLPWDELAIPGAETMALRYSILELNTAVKPFLFQHLLAQEGAGPVVYLDPDIVVYRRLEELERRLEAGVGLVLTPHITSGLDDGLDPDELALLRSGVYNLGFLAVAPGVESDRLLTWWAERLQERCLVEPEAGLFVDQRWMDFAPAFHESTEILHHPGYNVAYWNLHERKLTAPEAGQPWLVNGAPLAFFHFSGVVPGDPTVFSKHQNRFRPDDLGPARALFEDYLQRLADNRCPEIGRIPYAYGRLPSGRPLHGLLRRAGRGAGPADFEQRADQADPAYGPLAPITRLMAELWRERADLQAAFDVTTALGRLAFLRWFAEFAERDLGLDRASVEHALALTPLPAGGDAMITLTWRFDEAPPGDDGLLSVNGLCHGSQDVTLRLPPCARPPAALEVRPVDRPRALRLEALRLKAAGGQELWCWQGRLEDLSPTDLHLLPDDQGPLLVALGPEGRLKLPLNEGHLAALSEGADLDCRLRLLAPDELLGHLLARLEEGKQQSAALGEAIAAMEASSSWRLTKPLRQAKTLLGKS
ncbi:MAG: hypothetical protein AAF495_21645 [Pseudomonadota bacterium]